MANDLNPRAVMGANGGPELDPILIIQANYDDTFAEVSNWLDGSVVENEGQMRAVDALLATIKVVEKEAKAAKEEEYRPLKEACDYVGVRWNPFLSDLDRQRRGLAAAQEPFKRALAAKQEAERMEAQRVAWEKERAAAQAARSAPATDLEAQRAAAAAIEEAEAAQARVSALKKETVKGLRKVTRVEVTAHAEVFSYIKANDRDALTAFIEEWARANYKHHPNVPGLRVYDEKVAF